MTKLDFPSDGGADDKDAGMEAQEDQLITSEDEQEKEDEDKLKQAVQILQGIDGTDQAVSLINEVIGDEEKEEQEQESFEEKHKAANAGGKEPSYNEAMDKALGTEE